MPDVAGEDRGRSDDAIIDKFRELLSSSDANPGNWKEQAEALLRQSLSEGRIRKTTFTFGDEDDETSEDSKDSMEMAVQTESKPVVGEVLPTLKRTIEELESDWNRGAELLPGDVLRLLNRGKAKQRELEGRLPDYETAVAVRRAFVAPLDRLAKLPYTDFDYKFVTNACCENVVGYVPVPVGVAGPLKINGERPLYVPLATTEGALVASTNRGCTAIMKSGGVSSHIYAEGMTRAPVVQFERAAEAVRLKQWVDAPDNFAKIKGEFDASSRFAKLDRLEVRLDGRQAHLRFTGKTGDAMGMNMISKATSQSMKFLQSVFPTMKVVALSGNSCTDKKAAAINWISGRGRSVVADCVLPASVVKSVLKTTPAALAEASRAKLDSGSAAAGAIGGSNAHAANIVAAVFIATGQDAAQVVSSSMCATRLDALEDGSLYASVTLPCVECGTVGGGTVLPAQRSCLEMLGVAGPSPATCAPGTNAASLAQIIAATVLAGELSLMAALCTDDLVSSHLKLNRSRLNLYETAQPEGSGGSPMPTVQLLHPHMQPIRGKSADRTIKVNCSSIL